MIGGYHFKRTNRWKLRLPIRLPMVSAPNSQGNWPFLLFVLPVVEYISGHLLVVPRRKLSFQPFWWLLPKLQQLDWQKDDARRSLECSQLDEFSGDIVQKCNHLWPRQMTFELQLASLVSSKQSKEMELSHERSPRCLLVVESFSGESRDLKSKILQIEWY